MLVERGRLEVEEAAAEAVDTLVTDTAVEQDTVRRFEEAGVRIRSRCGPR